jgi:uncharacterized protein YrrD
MADDKNQAPEDVGAPVSYLVLKPGTPVFDRSGESAGTVEHVLTDDREDVFHGLVLKTDKGHRYAASALVDGIFERAVIIAVSAAELPEPTAEPGLVDELKRAWNWIIQPK